MKDSPKDQTIALIERHQRILLCTHRKPDGDAIGSIMGLARALKLMGKDVVASCADQLPEQFEFLPDVKDLQQDVHGQQDFVITLDCDDTEVDRLKYHLEDNKIHIVVTPKAGSFSPDKVSSYQQQGDFDLIITVDVADVPQLGKLYDDNKDLFMKLPVINIDHHVSNTEFGKLNWIDVAASSTAEILFDLVKALQERSGKTLMTPETATFLLSGVTTDTGSFQNANTTPKAMSVAADLIDAGANQHDVVKYLFRTKKLTTLKLWGKILSKIEVDEKHRLVWSTITQQDIASTGAHMDQAGDIIDELLVHAPEADIVALFKEDSDMVSVSLRSKNHQANVMEVAQKFHGGGHVQAAGAKFSDKSLSEVIRAVLEELQKSQSKRLGLSTLVADEDADAPREVTQVLDGYTPVPHKVTLEERVTQQASVTQSIPEKPPSQPAEKAAAPVVAPAAEASVIPPAAAPTPTTVVAAPATPPAAAPPTPASSDIHETTKAAIQSEQSQASDSGFSPSQTAQAQRDPNPNPQQERRFTEPVPDYLKPTPAPEQNPAPTAAPAQPAAPAPTPKPDDGVTVKMAAPGTVPPAPIAADSSEPVVKNMNPTGSKTDQNGEDDAPPAAPSTPNTPPEPPKDPFAMGDDGLTDIERALGGL